MESFSDMNLELIERFLRDLYMDDCISGSQTLQGAFDFYLYSKLFMQEGSFVLRKLTTNNSELRSKIEANEKYLGEPDVCRRTTAENSVLGVAWATESGELEFSYKNDKPLTNVLSYM